MIGTKLAHYEITSHLGSGGMGEVYQATDSKLGRSVAIKLLPEAFALDPDRLARFEREARLLASLNHANIAHIHGLDDAGGRTFLVMELVPGETLAERIARGPIQVDETLVLARQIADALEAAHEQGIVHRDLKPANVKVTPQGQVKVLDFGLAKAFAGEAAGANLSHSPTLSLAATQAGAILGTAAYMSPEQAKGKETDRRTDVWAFGCVLYEMLTGRAAFEGDTLGEILGSVFRAEPDWKKLPDALPTAVRRLLERCLKKDPSLRLHAIADARLDILDAQNGFEAVAPQTSSASRRDRLAWMALAATLVTAASLAAAYVLRPAPVAPELRLDMTTPAGNRADLAFSPDGERIAFIGTSNGTSQIWLRSIRSGEAQPLAGTENGSAPFWSPDGASIGFTAGGKLKRTDATTGAVETISDASPYESGGSWNTDGVILFAPSTNAPLFRVPAGGGSPEPVTRLKPGMETGHFEPFFLPDGHHFLFRVATNSDEQEIQVADLNGSEPQRLVAADGAVYASGQLYFVRSGRLFAQPFDASSLALSGAPVELAESIAERGLSVSTSGAIAYRTSAGGQQFQMAWFDRSGREVQKLGVLDSVYRADPKLSPDGSRVMFTRVLTSGHADIWMMDTARGNAVRITTDPADDILPVWSRDGARIAFSSARKGNGGNDLYWKALAGAPGSEELLLDNGERNVPSSWSPDGRLIAYTAAGAKTNMDIWALPIGDGRKPFVLVQTPFSEANAQFSPDGKWIAYESDESGRREIYVQPFPGPANKSPASTEGGTAVQWRDDGQELYFRGQNGQFMAVAVQLDANGKDIQLGVPAPLFALPDGVGFNGYGVTRDGQRFIVDTTIDPPLSPIRLILNWKRPGT